MDPKPSDPMHTQYDLLSNVFLDTTTASTSSSGTGPGKSKRNPAPGEKNQMSWKIHVRAGHAGGNANGNGETENRGEKWFELQDLNVTEVRKEMVFLGETVVQVWERKDLSEGKKY